MPCYYLNQMSSFLMSPKHFAYSLLLPEFLRKKLTIAHLIENRKEIQMHKFDNWLVKNLEWQWKFLDAVNFGVFFAGTWAILMYTPFLRINGIPRSMAKTGCVLMFLGSVIDFVKVHMAYK